MTYGTKGSHVTIDNDHPRALGICDYTGFVHLRSDLVKQMEWRGDNLVWTGFYVGKDYVDTPNEQGRPPLLPPDPVPVQDPRGMQTTIITWTNGQNDIWSQVPIDVWASWIGCEDGVNALPPNQRLAMLQNVYWGA
jgi:hypothetical protein